jgi:hypothetical protein
MKIPEQGKLLRIFIGESDRWHHRNKTGSSSQGMTAKDPGNFQKQYNSRITWDFQLQPCTRPKLKIVGHSKNNTDAHRPKFYCVI